MKIVYPRASVDCLKRKKPAKSKSVATINIAQRYMELLRLRGQVHELEGKQRSSKYGGAARSVRSRSRLSRSYHPGIV
jgi:hypothetical protein